LARGHFDLRRSQYVPVFHVGADDAPGCPRPEPLLPSFQLEASKSGANIVAGFSVAIAKWRFLVRRGTTTVILGGSGRGAQFHRLVWSASGPFAPQGLSYSI